MANKDFGVLTDEKFEFLYEVVKDGNGVVQRGICLGDTNYQNEALCLVVNKGEVRRFAASGVGIANYINSDGVAEMLREIRIQLERDGRTVEELSIGTDGKLILKSNYNG